MVNQVELHIGESKSELLAYCFKNNIVVESYPPIDHGRLLKNSEIDIIAKKMEKAVAQICIGYLLQKNTVVLPKTVHEKYMIQNADIDFIISDEDMLILDNIKVE